MLAMQVVMKTLSKECKVKKNKQTEQKTQKHLRPLPCLTKLQKGPADIDSCVCVPSTSFYFFLSICSLFRQTFHRNFHLNITNKFI